MKASLDRWIRVLTLSAYASVLSSGPAALFAQQNVGAAAISGTAKDQAGQVLPGASIDIKNESTGFDRKTTTDNDGRFSTGGLPIGIYTVEASAGGFNTVRQTGVKLVANDVQELTFSMKVADVSQTVTVEAAASVAANLAPMQSSLDARSARTEISGEFIQNFTSPVSDYTEVLLMSPGTFSVNSNGVGLGDSKTYFRGFSDGQYTMTFDGIPFNDTNSPTHHSWAFFPSQWIGATDFDRSPGTASTIGPTNFGGSINLISEPVPTDMNIRGSVSYGSFNTRLYDFGFDSGQFGPKDKSSLLIDLHQLQSDGYQTYNNQKRDAGSLKYQYRLSERTTVTVFGGLIDLFTNTPNTKGPTRAQVAQFGDNYLLSGDPTSPAYYGFNFYHVQSDFEYIGVNSDLGNGWKLDNKTYTYRYWNKQNYNGSTITATSATDKLNGYRKVGDVLAISKDTKWGIFRTGAWYEWAYTDRYQIPSDPRTWVDSALPNFHEKFNTQSVQPFAEFEARVTRRLTLAAGIKLAAYNQTLDQYADNGKTVGNLGGVAFVNHSANYHTWMPTADARYRLRQNWSVYGQFATGSVIPPSSVFDVKNAIVAVLPKPTTVKTYQVGSVYKMNRVTLDVDAYYSRFQNGYSSAPDPITGEPVYYLTGSSRTKGIEAESNIYAGRGLSLYLNGTLGQAKYITSGLWLANAPRNTSTIGLTYQHRNWDLGYFNKRIGQMYNDNGGTNQAVSIDPFYLNNVFFNYTLKGESRFRETKFRVSVNNLLDSHNIVGVTPASTTTSVAAPGDVLTLLPGRSIIVSITGGFAPRR